MASTFSRRSFLAQGALATGVALSARAQEGTAASPAAASETPANKIRLAVIGTNGRGAALASAFTKQSGAEVIWICDVDDQAAAKGVQAVVSAGGKPPRSGRDLRRVLDDQDVDAVVIATPDHWHAPAAILACAAGKHVYCEKPACHNPQEGEWMVQAARQHQRVVQIGTQRRSSPGVREAVERVQRGEIGRVRFARGWIASTRPSIGHGQEAPPPERLDYSLWQGPAPEVPYRDNVIPYHWHWFWRWGTGELGNNGIHALDVCRWGLEVGVPQRVTCGGGKLFFDDDQETPDTQLVAYDYGDKSIAWEHRTWNKRGLEADDFGIVFYGDNGAVAINKRGFQVCDMAGAEKVSGKVASGEPEHLQDFLDCIRHGGRPRADVEIGVGSTLLCHLGNIAYRTGRTVNLDSATGKIRDDAEQQALWQRDYNPAWTPRV